MTNIGKLRDFVVNATRIVARQGSDELKTLQGIEPLLATLVEHDDWLPEEYTIPDSRHYRQYLLHADPQERLSIVSFVWGPGQRTPIHDHLVWGAVGVLRGAELSTTYERRADGTLIKGPTDRLEAGGVVAVSPRLGDIHEIANALTDRPSISIHVYGGNIGAIRRHVFDPSTGAVKPFVSGYSNRTVPNLWDRSEAA